MNQYSRIFLGAFLTLGSALAADAQTPAPTPKLNPAELWVVEQVKAGKIADLSEKFPTKEERKLGAKFLEDLLTGVKPHRHGVRIRWALIDEDVDLTNAKIAFEVWLANCEFQKNATFMRADFGGVVLFNESVFKRGAEFNSMKVGSSAFFESAFFEGPVDFASTEIASNFEVNGAHFKNTNLKANFGGMKAGKVAFFRTAVFEGPVDFGGADFGDFVADGAQFKNKDQEANFNSMKVGNNVSLKKAVFEGPVDFVWASMGNFQAGGAEFRKKDIKAAPKLGVTPTPEANFNNMKVEKALFAEKTIFRGTTRFSGVKVSGASFEGAIFDGPVEFRYADFDWLNVSGVSWPKDTGSFDMQGMTYQYIRAFRNNDRKSHEMLLELTEHAPYSADVYGTLEAFFLRQGYRAHADKAFIAGKRRGRREHLFGIQSLGSLVLDLLVGYGRHPWQIGIPCAVLIGFGVVLFRPKKMEPQKMDAIPRIYSRFWYSLGLFLPIVNLESDKVWKPKPEHTFLRNYMRVHILLGWILIPILLAALTGLIK